jgi:hypothetical protein
MISNLSWTRLVVLCALPALIGSAFANPAPSKSPISVAAEWFENLEWPDLRGTPYIEITLGKSIMGNKVTDGPRVRGFLMGEDDQAFTVFADGTCADSSFSSGAGWPFVVQRIPKSNPEWPDYMQRTHRMIELSVAVDEVLKELHRPKEDDEYRHSRIGKKVTTRTALFVLARCCAKQGRADLADKLDAEVIKLSDVPLDPTREGDKVLRLTIEKEVAHALMWRAVVDCGDPSITRPELLARFERIVREFPNCEHHRRAIGFVENLRSMIAEDKEHAQIATPLEAMKVEEKIKDLIFRLRDQNGHQWGQPGSCDIFSDGRQLREGNSPAHQLVKLGHAAVPALIEVLDDHHLSRSVGYHRDFYFSHSVLTVGECAEAVLSKIAGRSNWVPKTTIADYEKGRQVDKVRTAIEGWWRGVQGKGEKQILIDGVREGNWDSYEQAKRLATLDPEAALDALAAGLAAATTPWDRTRLVESIASIKTDAAADALRREVRNCASLGGRVAAATELFRRGDKDAVAPMIEEWRKWIPLPRGVSDVKHESADHLIVFLGTCGDADAMKALASRFAMMPPDIKLAIVGAATDNTILNQSVRKRGTPLSPEAEAVAEELTVTALEDRTVRLGMNSTYGDVTFQDPRVCDFAVYSLSKRWSHRYHFSWAATRLERDVQITQSRNVWRAAHGQEHLPLRERPSHISASFEPNTIAALKWIGGTPMDGLPFEVGKPLTAEALMEAIIRLHRELPKDHPGFAFSAERPGDRRGFVIEIEWKSGTPPASPTWWRHGSSISLGDNSLHHSSGGSSFEYRKQSAAYNDEQRAIARALASDATQPITIYFESSLSAD